MPESPSLDLSFLRSFSALRRIALITLVGLLAGLAYAFLAPKWYRSVLTIVPAKSQKAGLSGLLGGELGGLAAGFEGATGGGADVQRITAVLQSAAVTDAVIEKFDLRTRYGEKYQELTREAVWKHCDAKALPKPSLVELSCEDKDPHFVQAMLGYFADYGNQVFRRVGVSSASEQVRFLERHVEELRQQANATGARMREFQEQHGIVDLDTQAKALMTAMASLQSQRVSKELELDYARTFSASDEASLQQLRSQLSIMDEKMRDMQDPSAVPSHPGKRARQGSQDLFPAALAVPKLRAEFETLFRDRKVAEATLIFSLEHLESARADEARDVSTFQILAPPALPTRQSRPKRLKALFAFAVAALIAGTALEYLRSRRVVAGSLAWLRGNPPPGGPPELRNTA